jgi:serine-type D-Ala-D-Ala carboxypeptidase/endopeptidase
MTPLLRAALPCAVALLAACGGGSDPAPAPVPPPAPPPSANVWSTVDALASEGFRANPTVTGMTVAIYDTNHRKLFEQTYGDFAPTRRVAVASASKMVSGVLLFRLIGQGKLSLDSTTGQVLGWQGERGTITLRHLLSFTSGLIPDAPCINRPGMTLAECVNEIRDDPAARVAAPGTRYDYGSTHQHVAARMAEVVSGKTWNQLFADELATPLGLPADVTYYTFPDGKVGTTNPRIAGGMQANVDEYARLLALSLTKGVFNGVRYAPAELFDVQAIEPYPQVVVGASPMAAAGYSFRYGLSAWLECSTRAAGCTVISSPGAFGWTPWVDRDAGYLAIIGLRSGSNTVGDRIAPEIFAIAKRLQPEIRKALGK